MLDYNHMIKRFLIIILIASVGTAITPALAARIPKTTTQTTDIVSAMKTISTTTVWPVSNSTNNDIESTFGPRVRSSSGGYDFHDGIDIDAPLDTPVLAAANGVLWEVTNYTNGGTTVIIRHTFPTPVLFNGIKLTYYYTFYMHLNSVSTDLITAAAASKHPTIAVGRTIGTVGHSGAAVVGDHLHFEMRVGTWCSLEYQLAHPTSSCAVGFGFDPAMNSLFLFPQTDASIQLTKQNSSSVLIQTNKTEPTVNAVTVTITNRSTGASTTTYTLNFNNRTGFNATSDAAIDTQDTTHPYMAPLPFDDLSSVYQTSFVLPTSFTTPYPSTKYKTTVTVTDIWGTTKTISW